MKSRYVRAKMSIRESASTRSAPVPRTCHAVWRTLGIERVDPGAMV